MKTIKAYKEINNRKIFFSFSESYVPVNIKDLIKSEGLKIVKK